MKIIRYTIRGIVIAMTLCLFAQGSFAYAPATTHAGLSQEIVSFYEMGQGDVLSDTDTTLLVQGSIDEDTPSTRSLTHFYDPVHGVGLNDYRPSIDWVTNNLSGNEFTWGRGIEAYAKGDEHTAMVTLGHVIHLIEDASVPDHTRNDPHMGDGAGGLNTGRSPFEYWTNEHKNRTTLLGEGKKLASSGAEMNNCAGIKECFQFMASYSNGNFFSEDTIGSSGYARPRVSTKDEQYAYGQDEISKENVRLYRLVEKTEGGYYTTLAYDEDYSVISEYFDRITPQVIPVGARVIDLFMTEAKFARAEFIAKQKAEQVRAVVEQAALNNRLSRAGFFGQLAFGMGDLFVSRPAAFLSNTGSAIASAGSSYLRLSQIMAGDIYYGERMINRSGTITTRIAVVATQDFAVATVAKGVSLAETGAAKVSEEVARIRSLLEILQMARQTLQSVAAATPAKLAVNTPIVGEVLGASTTAIVVSGGIVSSPPAPAYGGRIILGVAQGSAPIPTIPPPPPPIVEETSSTTNEVATTTPDVTPPSAPTILDPSSSPYHTATTNVHLSGTAEASSTVMLSWNEGVIIYALLFATTEDGRWEYDIVLSDTGSDGLGNGGTTTLTLTAEDAAGNSSDATTIDVVVTLPAPEIISPIASTSPRTPLSGELILNEVAWGGTSADVNDEWIELFNTTREELYLSGVTLKSSDDGISLPLHGVLPPRGYLVLSRAHADGTHAVSGPTHILELAFGEGLDDAGEELKLLYATTSSDGVSTEITIDNLAYCLNWCGMGGIGTSMERWRSDRPTGDYVGNWSTDSVGFDRGADSLGDIIGGTPGARNGSNYLLSLGNTIAANLVLSAEDGGYIINGRKVTLTAGNTLTLDPGVVIKSQTSGNSLLNLRGVLLANGTAEKPVIFTTTWDDRFAGDLLGDGDPSVVDTTVRAGGLDFYNTSAGSLLAHVFFYNLKTGPYFDRTTATMTSVSIIDSNDGIELFKSTINASDVLLRNISGNDAIQIYQASTLRISSSTIINVGRSDDAIDIHTSTLVADDIRVDGVGGSILRLNNSTSTVLGVDAGSAAGSVDIFVSGGNTSITDMVLSGGNGTGVTVSGKGTLVLASSTVSDYSFAGIFVAGGGNLSVSSTTLSDNAIGIYLIDGTANIHDSVIDGNGTGISNTDIDAVVDASNNYWGDPDGPTIPSGTPEGDSVSVNVLMDAFLVAPPVI